MLKKTVNCPECGTEINLDCASEMENYHSIMVECQNCGAEFEVDNPNYVPYQQVESDEEFMESNGCALGYSDDEDDTEDSDDE